MDGWMDISISIYMYIWGHAGFLPSTALLGGPGHILST